MLYYKVDSMILKWTVVAIIVSNIFLLSNLFTVFEVIKSLSQICENICSLGGIDSVKYGKHTKPRNFRKKIDFKFKIYVLKIRNIKKVESKYFEYYYK